MVFRRRFAARGFGPTLYSHWTGPWVIVLIGCGVVGRALLLALSALGCFDFILVDPKRYSAAHVAAGQCREQEAGKYKVQVLARVARRHGCGATSIAGDIAQLGEGIFGPGVLLVTALDSLPAQLAANQLARRMRLPLVRLNTAPTVDLMSVRVYATHRADGVCVACGLARDTVRRKTQPGRAAPVSTYGCGPGSSGLLAQMAARLGRSVIQALADSRSAAAPWWNSELQLSLRKNATVVSRLTQRNSCTTCHAPPWENLIYCSPSAESATLRQLIRAAVGHREAWARVRFCHALARRAYCPQCGHRARIRTWVAAYRQTIDACPNCGFDLVSSAVASEFSNWSLASLRDLTIRELRLAPGGIVSVRAGDRECSFVLGALRDGYYGLGNGL